MIPVRSLFLAVLMLAVAMPVSADRLRDWMEAWPNTDFSRAAVPLEEIKSAGSTRDGIPPIDEPQFVPADKAPVPSVEPVVSITLRGEARAYPLRQLIWHQIVNDDVGGVPIAVTYCPLCSVALVYDRRVNGKTLQFGTTGLIRYSGLIMYDRQSESWWQQYEGQAIVGKLAGTRLTQLPSRLESMGRFAERNPHGRVLVPDDEDFRPYGRNPYTGYDGMPSPFLYEGPLPEGIAPLARVVAVDDRAWSLDLIRDRRKVEVNGLMIEWSPGQSSALDAKHIAEGRDIGNVVVRKRRADGWEDVPYSVEFAFVFKAFHPDKAIVAE